MTYSHGLICFKCVFPWKISKKMKKELKAFPLQFATKLTNYLPFSFRLFSVLCYIRSLTCSESAHRLSIEKTNKRYVYTT